MNAENNPDFPLADVVSLEIPKGADLRLEGKPVEAILVQCWWASGKRPALDFAMAIIANVRTERAMDTDGLFDASGHVHS